jgi:hypothetical protein
MRLTRLLGIAAAAAVVTSTALPALATNTLGHRAGWDATVKFNKSALTLQFRNAVNFNDTNNIIPTDITSQMFTDQTQANMEVNIYDSTYGDTGWYGRWFCQVWASLTVCSQGRVQLNLTYGPYTDVEARSLTCEEVGHSVGLNHSGEDASCMSQQWDKTLLTTHDKGHLNAKY